MGGLHLIKQIFYIEHYWKVIAYHNIEYKFFRHIYKDLYNIGFSNASINRIYKKFKLNQIKAVTCSSPTYKTSILIFAKHDNSIDYINSIVHESEHLKQVLLKVYKVYDEGEPPAYTVGYIASKLYSAFKLL